MLSSYELLLVTDPQVMLTKNAIMKKVVAMFGETSHGYVDFASQNCIDELLQTPPKISKGENYLGLPYVILDYPRIFGKEDMLAIRSFFWWGNYFSIYLLISGEYKIRLEEHLEEAVLSGMLDDWMIQVNDDKWNHQIGVGNYKPLKALPGLSFKALPFIKLAKKIPLHEWDKASIFYENNFKILIGIINGIKYPN